MTTSKHTVLGSLNLVIDDMLREFQELSCTINACRDYLDKIATSRGRLNLLCGTLPQVGKVFDKGLSSGYLRLIPHNDIGIAYHTSGRSPLSRLLSQVYDSAGYLHPETDPTLIFYLRTLLYSHKKLKVDCPMDAVATSVMEFIQNDEELRQPDFPWGRSVSRMANGVHTSTNLCRVRAASHHATRGMASQPILPLHILEEGAEVGTRGRRLVHSSANPADAPGVRARYSEPIRSNGVQSHEISFREACLSSGDDCDMGSLNLMELLDFVCGAIAPRKVLDPLEIVPRHGPGAVSDVRTGEDKYQFLHWPEKLGSVFDESYFRTHRDMPDILQTLDYAKASEPPGKLLAVPKDYRGPRLITSEPAAHQFLQQGLLRWFRDNLTTPLRNCVNFNSQLENQRLAQSSSVDGRYATIDLKSASDRLSCWTVERVFRVNPSIIIALNSCRTSVVINSTGAGPVFSRKLRKFAGQGSAVTFPIQSITYAAVAIAATMASEGLPRTYASVLRCSKKVRVFGDDMIIPVEACSTTALILKLLQLKINQDKSHHCGKFRESCGGDYYDGYDVTPLYFSHESGSNPESKVSLVEVSNNAHRKGLWITAKGLAAKSLLPDLCCNISGCISLVSFCSGPMTAANTKVRYNRLLHRWELRSHTLQSRQERDTRSNWNNLLQYFIEEPSAELLWKAGWTKRNFRKLKRKWVSILY